MVRVGDIIELTENAIEAYGEKYAGHHFIVTQVTNNRRKKGEEELVHVKGLKFSLYESDFDVVGHHHGYEKAKHGFHGKVAKRKGIIHQDGIKMPKLDLRFNL